MSYSPVRHSLYFYNAFDLHVLGTPPAFILSQDQTLHCFLISSSFDSFFYRLLLLAFLLFIDVSFCSVFNVLFSALFLTACLYYHLFFTFATTFLSFFYFFLLRPFFTLSSSTSSFLLLDTLSFYINSIPFSIKLLKLKWFYTIL